MEQAVKQYPQSLEYLVNLHCEEDYETLRQDAQELKASGKDAATRALGAFFYEDAAAWFRWFVSYDYDAIRKTEEDARHVLQKQRQHFPDADSGAVIFALEALSQIVTEGTYIENGMIASDPLPMYEHSQRLEDALKKAHEWLSHWKDAHPVFLKELEWRMAVNHGNVEYAGLLTHFPYDKAYFLANVAQVDQRLDDILNEHSDEHLEACSDLRPHKEFLRHYRSYLEQAETTPCFRHTRISWLLNFQIDRALASWLCDQLTEEQGREHAVAHERRRFRSLWHKAEMADKRGVMDRRWKLPHIEYIKAGDSQDYLETSFGEHDMRCCIVTFKPIATHLASLADVVDDTRAEDPDEITMALKIYAYGVCTVEFALEDLDLDIFQLRQISALIAPFAHKSSYTWVEGHEEIEAEQATHHDESQLEPLAENVCNGLKATLLAYIKEHLERFEKAVEEKGRAEDQEQVRELKELQAHALDENNWIYAPHLNWYTYANPRQMMLAKLEETTPGEKTLLPSPLGDLDLATLPEYKGLVLPLREKRASLHDWLAMQMPVKRNLATITSHTDDLFFVSNHSALLYFPDDPNFIVQQFIGLVETATRLYCLVTSMVARSKIEFDELAALEKRAAIALDERGKEGTAERKDLLAEIRARQTASEHFDSDARRSLDLLTLRIISKYIDTTKLMQAITDELEVTDLRGLFDVTMERVNRKRVNLLTTMTRLQEHEKEQQARERKNEESKFQARLDDQNRRLQNVVAIMAALLAVAGVDVIITDFDNVIHFGNYIHLALMLGIILAVLGVLFYLLQKVRAANKALDNWERKHRDSDPALTSETTTSYNLFLDL